MRKPIGTKPDNPDNTTLPSRPPKVALVLLEPCCFRIAGNNAMGNNP